MQKRGIERHMFYGARKKTFLKAVDLRNKMTEAENALWKELRNRVIFKARWKPQHPIDIFIVDFYCHKYKLAIEVDGGIHLNQEVLEHDEGRSHEIEKMGIKIIRFTNEEVLKNIESVKQCILKKISSLSSTYGI